MKYRLRIVKAEENELERLPLEVALKVEKYLGQMVQLAGETARGDPLWSRKRDPVSGFLRFELDGFCVLYEVDRDTESVVVASIKRLRPSGTEGAV